ncbi:MAG: hypothetical protein VX232_01575 [Pseudomonadota bacterium]|nr:hypothetical protein [Pseudomonadota bacterium]
MVKRVKMFLFACTLSLLVIGCEKNDYFPLTEGLQKSYKIVVKFENEPPVRYRIFSTFLKKIKMTNENSPNKEIVQVTPMLREDASVFYYHKNSNNIERIAYQPLGKQAVLYEEEPRYVIKYPIKKGVMWKSPSKTYLLLKHYPYYNKRITVPFKLSSTVEEINETVRVPAGTFKNCLKIKSIGETTFIGERGIGDVKVQVENTDWFSPKVGLIKTTRTEITSTDLYGKNKLTKELESYKIPIW